MQYGLGRKPSGLDIHDYELARYMPRMLGDLSGGMYWPYIHESLDQFDKPECVGFGVANFGINNPVADDYTNADGRKFYKMAKVIDGDNEEGSTVRSGAKVLQQIGRINHYAFASSVNEVIYWILHNGPVIVGTDWTYDMFTPDENNIVHPTGGVAGGHCYLFNEKTDTELFGAVCAWPTWGVNGKAYISIPDFIKLFRAGGEAMTAVELPLDEPIPQERDGCSALLATFAKWFG